MVQPWQFFTIVTAVLGAATIVLLRGAGVSALVLAVLTVAATGYAAYMVLRTLHPLVSDDDGEGTVMLGGRTRAALEGDKMLTLRSIKELEFDHAMGKVGEADFAEMRDRLRTRAVRLMKQLEGAAAYHAQIEQDLEARLAEEPAAAVATASTCGACGTGNDPDARFCKRCGQPLGEAP